MRRRAAVLLAVLVSATLIVAAADGAIAVMFDGSGGLTETPRLDVDHTLADPIPGGAAAEIHPRGGSR
jgi:hypothetical protein